MSTSYIQIFITIVVFFQLFFFYDGIKIAHARCAFALDQVVEKVQ